MKLLFVLLLLPCCAAAQTAASISSATTACGLKTTKFSVKTDWQQPDFSPNPTKAVVILAESFAAEGNGFIEPTVKIGMDGKWVGATAPSTWLEWTVDPGEHHLCIQWQSSLDEFSSLLSLAPLNAEAGKVYYFRARVLGLYKAPVLDLDPVNPDEGRYLAQSSQHSVPKAKK